MWLFASRKRLSHQHINGYFCPFLACCSRTNCNFFIFILKLRKTCFTFTAKPYCKSGDDLYLWSLAHLLYGKSRFLQPIVMSGGKLMRQYIWYLLQRQNPLCVQNILAKHPCLCVLRDLHHCSGL